ncbi:MAG: outer membrane beta-barrel protein [Blastocatellia bacterium]
MKKLTWFAGFLFFVFTQSAVAQETPRVEIFGGYSYLRVTTDDNLLGPNGASGSLDSISANGFMTSAAYNLTKRIGIVGEFSRHTKETNLQNLIRQTGIPNLRVETRVNTFLFGPRFTLRTDSIEPFAHFLVGGAQGSFDISGLGVSSSDSGTAFTFAAGGGVDIKFSPKIVVRLVQADYLRTTINGPDLDSGRISTGIVFRIGER